MTTFYVGQRVRVVAGDYFVGCEGRVVGPLSMSYSNRDRAFTYGYPVQVDGADNRIVGEGSYTMFASGEYGCFTPRPSKLEPILYDGNKTVEWSECLWQPNRQGAPA
jgi:hypothetical protein